MESFKEYVMTLSKRNFQEIKEFYRHPLITIAVSIENFEAIKFLVEEMGQDVNETSKNGETSLIRACYYNKLEIIKYLLSRGVDLEKRSLLDVNALIIAAMRNKPDIVEELIKHGAKIDL